MPAPTFNRSVGSLALPTTVGASRLTELDPGHKLMLELFAAAINAELAAAWATARTGTPLRNSSPVEFTDLLSPSKEYIQSTKVKWPALFVYPEDEPTIEPLTMVVDKLTQTWSVEYILGPLEPGDFAKLGAALRAVLKIVGQVVKVGGHPAYAMDENNSHPDQLLYWSGVSPSGKVGGGFSSVRVTGAQMGGASFNEDGSPPIYHGIRVSVETTEIDGPDNVDYWFDDHEGASFELGLKTPEQPDLDPFVELESDI